MKKNWYVITGVAVMALAFVFMAAYSQATPPAPMFFASLF